MDLVCWFSENDKRALGIPDLTEPSAAADTWHVPETALANSTGIDVLETPLFYAIQFLSSEGAAKRTRSERPEGAVGVLKEKRELRANVVWRFLHDRGYINPVSHDIAKATHPPNALCGSGHLIRSGPSLSTFF